MKSKIQIQLIIVYIVVLLTIIVGFLIYVTDFIFKPMQKEVIENIEYTAGSLTGQIESYFDNSDKVLINMIYKGTLQEYVMELDTSSSMDDLTRLQFDRKFDDLIGSLSTFPIIPSSHVTIYNRDLSYKYQYNTIKHTNLQQVLKNAAEREYLEHYNRVICRKNKWEEEDKTRTFSIVRLITNLSADELGYIELQMDYQDLEHICQLEEGRQAYLINQSGQMIYPDRNEVENELDFLSEMTSDRQGVIQTDTDIYVWEKIAGYDMTVVVKQNENELFQSLNELKRTTFLVLILLAFASVPVLFYFLFRTLRPIKDLTEQVSKVNYNRMEIEINNNSFSDEVKVLQNSFTDMLQRIRLSSEKEIFFQKEQERMKYETLQKQIAPHFIHNTLYVISIAAQEQRNEDVISMCKELSNIMRYSISMKKMVVPFEDELNYIKDYLKLQEENYGDDFAYDIEVSDSWLTVDVPRMFLQPFLENCFKHGFGNCEAPYYLKLAAKENNDGFALELEDNGAGIKQETIDIIEQRVLDSDTNDDSMDGGVGVVNTILRLKYLYGDKAEIKLERRTERGTMVRIFIRRL